MNYRYVQNSGSGCKSLYVRFLVCDENTDPGLRLTHITNPLTVRITAADTEKMACRSFCWCRVTRRILRHVFSRKNGVIWFLRRSKTGDETTMAIDRKENV